MSLIFMISLYTGAVRGQNESKYDLLRSPRESSLVFCLTSDCQYSVMNINYFMQHLKDQTSTQSNNLKLANLWKLFNLVINKQKLS